MGQVEENANRDHVNRGGGRGGEEDGDTGGSRESTAVASQPDDGEVAEEDCTRGMQSEKDDEEDTETKDQDAQDKNGSEHTEDQESTQGKDVPDSTLAPARVLVKREARFASAASVSFLSLHRLLPARCFCFATINAASTITHASIICHPHFHRLGLFNLCN